MTPAVCDRRGFLQAGALAAASGLVTPRPVLRAAEPIAPKRRIFAIGGGSMQGPTMDRLLLRYIVALTGKKDPTICLLPTAGADLPQSIVAWYEATNDLGCRPRHLRLISNSTNLKNLRQELLSMDAIHVGGGNTLSMLAIWKAHGIDLLLRQAWEQGTLITGESAGMICWFDQGVSDSRPGPLSAVQGLGWLRGSACPHYHHKDRRAECHRLLLAEELLDGIACDDAAGLLYEGDKLVRVVAAGSGAGAFYVRRRGDKVVEEPLEVEQLTKPS